MLIHNEYLITPDSAMLYFAGLLLDHSHSVEFVIIACLCYHLIMYRTLVYS